MKDALQFQNDLAEALEQRKLWLDRNLLPKLKDEFSIFKASFGSLYQLLLRKGLVQEDPYKNDIKIGELQVPSESPFTESERIEQMSIRLSNFDSQIDFLVTFYQFSVEFLNMERLKRVAGIVKYINWLQFSVNSQYINTRSLAEIVNLAKGGNDQLGTGLIVDSLQRLESSSKNILKILKDITDFHRQNYKLEARLRFFDTLPLDRNSVFIKKEETMQLIKRKFAETMSDRPFYPELFEELLKENYSAEGVSLKNDILKQLAIPEDNKEKKKTDISSRPMLIEALRGLNGLSFILTDTLSKLDENKLILDSEQNGFWQKVRQIILKMLNKDSEEVFYEIEYLDPVLGTTQSEKLNFRQFKMDLIRKARSLASLSSRNSAFMTKLENASEDQLFSILSKNIEELQKIHRTLTALDEFFKSEVSKENREKIRGIKPELSSIKNTIVKANQKRHEYIAQKEEQEQLKKLGIQDSQ
ncbi:hypothetical protein [Gracilinema caldarium]|uniref:Uncharacterized protein n=1 Tax=Gracilinema caldarium (strain ATCC 51460 / DSM 7334 / H1) TaxID=744872 RepID=F8F0U3_GRAC1|nr:hypothetical protein [Gracilinema caldarium]AEJ20229.1 hypothetical protein Spica_2104 [Gracilinema caldarium DSM 7334]